MKGVKVASVCPMCRADALHLATSNLDIPYFGAAMETTLRCDACGFRHADFMILDQHAPLHLRLDVAREEDLRVRVIRSNSGTIRIPELGFTAEPTALSESFVSNVEGVLERARGVLETARRFHGDDPEKRRVLDGHLERHARLVAGDEPFSLVIDDPFGNSAIVSERVTRRPLTEDEVAALATGVLVLDAADVGER